MTATSHRPTTPETTHANDELLTLPKVADLVRVRRHLRYWRHLGSGPQSFRIWPHRRLLAKRRLPVARKAAQSSTWNSLRLATVGDERD